MVLTNSLATIFMNQEKTPCSKRTTTSTPPCTNPQRSPATGASRLPVAPQGQGVVLLPGLSAAGLGLGVAVTLVEAAGLLAGGGEATGLAVLVDGVDDPVDAGVDADGLVLGVDEDDLVVLVGGVLVDPVRVQDAQVGATAADTLLGGGLQGALVLELVYTLVGGLACRGERRGFGQFSAATFSISKRGAPSTPGSSRREKKDVP